MFKILELSNKDKIALCEPFHEALFDILTRTRPGQPDGLHGIPIWDGYFKLPMSVYNKLREHHKDFVNKYLVLNDFSKVEKYLDILHELDKPVLFKTTRAWLILDKIKEKYGCKVVHLIRNPANTWMDFLHISIKNDERKFWKTTLTMYGWMELGRAFYLGPHFNYFSTFDQRALTINNLDRFLLLWTIANYNAVKKADLIIVYELVLKRRREYFDYLNTVLGEQYFSKQYVHLPNERLALEYPDRRLVLNYIIHNELRRLKLMWMYDEIYEKIQQEFNRFGIKNEFYPEPV